MIPGASATTCSQIGSDVCQHAVVATVADKDAQGNHGASQARSTPSGSGSCPGSSWNAAV
ncbi:hypothetical protein [Janthinobacterium sp. GMG1]|uniref:hypothetical protein n=1 Tax=Janthinobacterium sp. GMG1 TaxID=3096007 RepID=UPI002ACAD9F4|nr:hypothetical protein [Janthinobacterium sp. GMG1]MDZ5633537.1 hypothetical protein [Janthinobacterium sp. GMG1]